MSKFLLPNTYKPFGWVFLCIGLAVGAFVLISGYDSELIQTDVFAIYSNSIIGKDSGFFKIVENNILDEIATMAIIVGGLLVGFSKEKVEDEYIAKLRTDSLIWALVVNYSILLVATIFVYDFAFFDVLVFNMFTPLLFFILRFNFLKKKA